MPDRSRLHWSQLKVGLLAIAAMAVLAALILLLTEARGIFVRDVTLHMYVEDAAGTTTAAPVRLHGFLVGHVSGIQLSGEPDPTRAVRFDLAVREDYIRHIPRDSVGAIVAATLLGDKFINITMGTSPQPIRAGEELRTAPTQDIPELMAQSAVLLETLQNIVRRVDTLLASVEAGEGNIGKLLRDEELYQRLSGMAAEGEQLLADIRRGKGTLSRLIYDDALYHEVRAPIRRIDAMLAELERGQGTAGRLLRDPALYDEAQRSLAELRTLVEGVGAGRGTVGRLVTDEELYNRMNVLVTRVDATLERINTGQGTLGQLLVNPQLYDAMSGSMREFQTLARDIRANPRRFLTIRVALF
jgi:phospholipid/cholesterol/gamma-HCH transport system substrate-binding protein